MTQEETDKLFVDGVVSDFEELRPDLQAIAFERIMEIFTRPKG